jgi:hypothetical protein
VKLVKGKIGIFHTFFPFFFPKFVLPFPLLEFWGTKMSELNAEMEKLNEIINSLERKHLLLRARLLEPNVTVRDVQVEDALRKAIQRIRKSAEWLQEANEKSKGVKALA